jgi:hypothetical protein
VGGKLMLFSGLRILFIDLHNFKKYDKVGWIFSRFSDAKVNLMFSQKVLGWLSKNFDIQGVVIF